jgi:hypothetical protein
MSLLLLLVGAGDGGVIPPAGTEGLIGRKSRRRQVQRRQPGPTEVIKEPEDEDAEIVLLL